MLNSSDQFFFFSGVTRETATDMECARHSRILVLPYLISDIMTQYAGILLHFIGQLKSTVAATAAMAINPKLHVETLQNRASPEIENVFNDAFWESLDAVVNALDNVTARMYIDSRCVYFQKPLLESGTLGAKCNTQMVIPHLTENYGASRDPPERQAPMCTIHSVSHNIDHYLTWARSEFEGLLEKTPTEVNAFLSNPGGYATAARTAGDVQARDQLERVIECLETDKCETFQDCITWARLKFEDYFSNRVKQLTFTFPEDTMTSSGAPFWSAPKRFPRPLEFSSSDSSILLDFVDSFEHHECKCLGITYVREKSITKNSQQQKGLAHHGISRLWVSDCPVSVFIYDDPLRGLVLAWEVTHIMGRCGLIANAPHRRGIKTTYAKWNIATESQVSLLLQVQWDPGGHHLNIVSFSTSVWVWDPGDLEHICLLLRRLGDKPCFKEGSMSGISWADRAG
jgi:molybdopterin/thiamine biosynthesis adenylyltransferase